MRTVLGGVLRGNRYDRLIPDFVVVVQPLRKQRPTGILDGLGQMMVLGEVLHLHVLIRHDVVRHHYAPGKLHDPVSTLALHFQMNLS